MNFSKEIERCMEIENVEEMRKEIKGYQEYFNSEEYLSNLTAKQRDLIENAKNYKSNHDVKLERTKFKVATGMACGPCVNLIGSSEIVIEKDGEMFYVSAHFVDEVPEEVALIVSREKSTWALYFDELRLPEEEDITEEDYEELQDYEVMYYSSDDNEWLSSEFADLFLAAMNNLRDELMVFDETDSNMTVDALCQRFFCSRLWFNNLAKEGEFNDIYDTISCY